MSVKSGLADPDLHLFLADDEIFSLVGVTRFINQMRRDLPHPVMRADQPWEWHHIQASKVLHDPEDDYYKCWYLAAIDGRPWPYSHGSCLAISRDGVGWEKPDHGVVGLPDGTPTNIIQLPRGTGARLLMPYIDVSGAEERFVATVFQNAGITAKTYDPPEMEQRGRTSGIHRAVSPDGIHWTVSHQPVIWAGDRNATAFDPVEERWLLTTRRPGALGPTRQRDLALWTSTDFRMWNMEAWLLRSDEHDRPNTEFYGMLPVRYGPGFIGFLEVYHRAVERLETQLCWSNDGVHWQRVGHRDPVLARGGEGDWDSHWVYVTNNDPEEAGDRLRFWYGGAATHHGAKAKHQRAMGLASIRRDGFVSIEGRMDPGYLVTAALDSTVPRQLTINVDAEAGETRVAVLTPGGGVIDGFSAEDCRLSADDGVAIAVSWRGGETVPAQPGGEIQLQFHLRNSSLYSYRWTAST